MVGKLQILLSLCDSFTYIVFDESESSFMQFETSTINDIEQFTKKFESIVDDAKHCGV